jgi:uncharacterized lipoprotein YmbA
MTRTRALASPLVAAALLAACSACSVKAPPRTAWSLSGGQAVDAPIRLAEGAPALGVSRFTAADEARSTMLTWRDGDGHQLHETADRWADYPDRMLQEMAMARLLRSGLYRSVTAAPPRDGVDAVLACRLIEFGEWDSPAGMETRVRLRWDLTSASGAVTGSGEAAGSSTIATKTMPAVVAAYSAATDQALSQLVAQLSATKP